MLFQCRVPAPPLDAFVETIWIYENEPRPHVFERLLPTGTPSLIVNLKENEVRRYESGGVCMTAPGTVLVGVQSRYSVIDTAEQEHVLGVSFKPGGAAPFVRAPAYETLDADVALDEFWGREGSTLRERILDAATPDAKLDVMERALIRAWRGIALHGAVSFALDRFRRRPAQARIADVTSAIGLSPKRFIERFKMEVGLTPKRYCRIVRLQQAIGRAHRGRAINWTELALDCGYFDQPHFVHEFQSLVGLSPTAYEAGRTEFQNHVTFLQD